MKLLLIIYTAAHVYFALPNQQSTAYICVSPSAKKYHNSSNCRGLQKCTHEIKQTTVENAKKLGYTVCLLE